MLRCVAGHKTGFIQISESATLHYEQSMDSLAQLKLCEAAFIGLSRDSSKILSALAIEEGLVQAIFKRRD